MEIADVRVHRLRVDLDRPLRLSRDRAIDSRAAAVVVVETTDGTCGVGEAVGTDPAIVKTIIEEKYAPRLVAKAPLNANDSGTNCSHRTSTGTGRDRALEPQAASISLCGTSPASTTAHPFTTSWVVTPTAVQ